MGYTTLETGRAILFHGEEHKKFYYENLKKVRYQDECHKALLYCLGISPGKRVDQRHTEESCPFRMTLSCLMKKLVTILWLHERYSQIYSAKGRL